jgi:phosphoinositide-3-kinase, regulatory subunit 4
LDPNQRPSFDTILQSTRGTLFPESFYSFLHNYISSVNELRSPSPFAQHQQQRRPMSDSQGSHSGSSSSSLPSDSDHRLDRIWNEFDSVESYLFLLPEEDDQLETRRDIEYHKNSTVNGRAFQVCFLVSFGSILVFTYRIESQDVLPVVLHLANREPQIHGVSPILSSIRRGASTSMSKGKYHSRIILTMMIDNISRKSSVDISLVGPS